MEKIGANPLEQAVYNTVRYFDLFDMPVTATQIWQTLLLETEQGAVRWGGHKHYRLRDIQDALSFSSWLKGRVGTKWGYVFLSGKEELVRVRLNRHALAQQKWKIARRLARVLSLVPLVKGLAGSGSLAAYNTKTSSDLDFLVIAAKGRIWTARLGLLIASQFLGRRRRHWDRQAPDKLCLNHYVTENSMLVPADIHNVYTVVLYSMLVPVYGEQAVHAFQDQNGSWIRQHIMSPNMPSGSYRYVVCPPQLLLRVKNGIEQILLEPVGDIVEYLAERVQRAVIEKHQPHRRPGRVSLSGSELAFHPDTKVPAILAAFNRDPGQRPLL